MDILKFSKIAESLRQYRRAELNDFEKDVEGNPIDTLYVDPLPSDAILLSVLSSNTTFLIGRKGTGKSTVFAKAQSTIREQGTNISVYIDVKTIYELLSSDEVPITDIDTEKISEEVLRTHLLRKHFLASVIADLLKELRATCTRLSLLEKLIGKRQKIINAMRKLETIEENVKTGKLTNSEIPVLQLISKQTKERHKVKEKFSESSSIEAKTSLQGISLGAESKLSGSEELLSDNELYAKYSDAIMRSFPFADILTQIKSLLSDISMKRLIIFFDDFSELTYIDQRLFVDVVLAPLNNASDEKIKMKVAGYPGRVYYGKIDPSKVDTISLDFFQLYKSQEIQTAENSAIEYTTRLLTKRFEQFGTNIEEYFETSTNSSTSTTIFDYMRLIFQCSMNIPRLMGNILFYCFRDRISKKQLINPATIRLASEKYYEDVLVKYFDRMNRFAHEPFEKKLDRHIQSELISAIVSEAKDVRKQIIAGKVGGSYFEGLSNPPASHFSVSPEFETLLSSLELNCFVSKYHDMRDKDGKTVAIYALFYGLCEAEVIPWGYPKGRRDDRSYFVQRCFSYNHTLRDFLTKHQTIRCNKCGATFPIDKKDTIAYYGWSCPECHSGKCSVINLADEYKQEIEKLNDELKLEPVEIDILEVLNQEDKPMRANEISAYIDVTYQRIGKRTSKMQESGYINKESIAGITRNSITGKAKEHFFK